MAMSFYHQMVGNKEKFEPRENYWTVNCIRSDKMKHCYTRAKTSKVVLSLFCQKELLDIRFRIDLNMLTKVLKIIKTSQFQKSNRYHFGRPAEEYILRGKQIFSTRLWWCNGREPNGSEVRLGKDLKRNPTPKSTHPTPKVHLGSRFVLDHCGGGRCFPSSVCWRDYRYNPTLISGMVCIMLYFISKREYTKIRASYVRNYDLKSELSPETATQNIHCDWLNVVVIFSQIIFEMDYWSKSVPVGEQNLVRYEHEYGVFRCM